MNRPSGLGRRPGEGPARPPFGATGPSSALIRRRMLLAQSRPDHLDAGREDRDHDDRDDHQVEVLLDDLQSREPPAREQEHEDPGHPAGHVVEGEAEVVHLADAGDERGECPDDRDEPREDDGEAAILLVEFVGAQQMLLVQEPGVLAREDVRPDVVADAVIDGVAQDRGDDQQQRGRPQVDRRAGMGRHGADREEERIARQDRRDHQPRLGEDDQEEHGVGDRRAHRHHERVDRIRAEVDQGIEELLD